MQYAQYILINVYRPKVRKIDIKDVKMKSENAVDADRVRERLRKSGSSETVQPTATRKASANATLERNPIKLTKPPKISYKTRLTDKLNIDPENWSKYEVAEFLDFNRCDAYSSNFSDSVSYRAITIYIKVKRFTNSYKFEKNLLG